MKRLTIALLGNTNNYPLLLAEGFIKLGHNVRLLINRTELLHRPESKYPEWRGKYPSWIYDYSKITEFDIAYETPEIDVVVNQLTNGVDLAILNDIGPAYVKYLRCPHVAFLTGSDLSYYANFDSVERRTANWDPAFRRSREARTITRKLSELVISQRDGILTAEAVSFPIRGLIEHGDKMLDTIGITDSQRFMIELSDIDNLSHTVLPENNNLRILNGSRVVWRQTSDNRYFDMDLKGTDILIKGFALFCQAGGKGELRMFRKGGDASLAVDLISSLGIEQRVVWIDEIPLNEFHAEIALADIICDNFTQTLPGMVTKDAYALGRPVLANLRNDIFGRHYPQPLPGLQAVTPEEVCQQLLLTERDKDILSRIGRESRQFAEAYLSPVKMAEMVLERCIAVIKT